METVFKSPVSFASAAVVSSAFVSSAAVVASAVVTGCFACFACALRAASCEHGHCHCRCQYGCKNFFLHDTLLLLFINTLVLCLTGTAFPASIISLAILGRVIIYILFDRGQRAARRPYNPLLSVQIFLIKLFSRGKSRSAHLLLGWFKIHQPLVRDPVAVYCTDTSGKNIV